jgi:hypothetical protein
LILSTYTCSTLCSLPEEQLWGSNTFSSSLKCSFHPHWQWATFVVGCWHNTTCVTTTSNNHLQPRKQVRTKSSSSLSPLTIIMPTSRDVDVSSVLEMDGVIDLISNKVEADKFVAKMQSCNFPESLLLVLNQPARSFATTQRPPKPNLRLRRRLSKRRRLKRMKKRNWWLPLVSSKLRPRSTRRRLPSLRLVPRRPQRKQKPYKSNWHQSKPLIRQRGLSQGTGELMFPRRARALGERWPC